MDRPPVSRRANNLKCPNNKVLQKIQAYQEFFSQHTWERSRDDVCTSRLPSPEPHTSPAKLGRPIKGFTLLGSYSVLTSLIPWWPNFYQSTSVVRTTTAGEGGRVCLQYHTTTIMLYYYFCIYYLTVFISVYFHNSCLFLYRCPA